MLRASFPVFSPAYNRFNAVLPVQYMHDISYELMFVGFKNYLTLAKQYFVEPDLLNVQVVCEPTS